MYVGGHITCKAHYRDSVAGSLSMYTYVYSVVVYALCANVKLAHVKFKGHKLRPVCLHLAPQCFAVHVFMIIHVHVPTPVTRTLLSKGVLISVCKGVLIRVCKGVLIRMCEGVPIRVCKGVLIRVCKGVLIRMCEGVLIRVCVCHRL